MGDAVQALIVAERLPQAFRDTLDRAIRPLAARVCAQAADAGRPLVVGLCGSQGSGKSTFAAFLALLLETAGLRTAVLSLDDLYLRREEREALARTRHPLFRTRGPPGAHDIRLGVETLGALTRPGPRRTVRVPRFDKGADTRLDPEHWSQVDAPVDVLLFEGWFVGARPEPLDALAEPVNALERDEDPDGRWRRAANAALADDYPALFARIDLLVLLQAPGFDQVRDWRGLQEARLAERLRAEERPGEPMTDEALDRFVMHYERLTRWILHEMPARADVVVRLGPDHAVVETRGL
jgi:D-glycerate 3-kinase